MNQPSYLTHYVSTSSKFVHSPPAIDQTNKTFHTTKQRKHSMAFNPPPPNNADPNMVIRCSMCGSSCQLKCIKIHINSFGCHNTKCLLNTESVHVDTDAGEITWWKNAPHPDPEYERVPYGTREEAAGRDQQHASCRADSDRRRESREDGHWTWDRAPRSSRPPPTDRTRPPRADRGRPPPTDRRYEPRERSRRAQPDRAGPPPRRERSRPRIDRDPDYDPLFDDDFYGGGRDARDPLFRDDGFAADPFADDLFKRARERMRAYDRDIFGDDHSLFGDGGYQGRDRRRPSFRDDGPPADPIADEFFRRARERRRASLSQGFFGSGDHGFFGDDPFADDFFRPRSPGPRRHTRDGRPDREPFFDDPVANMTRMFENLKTGGAGGPSPYGQSAPGRGTTPGYGHMPGATYHGGDAKPYPSGRPEPGRRAPSRPPQRPSPRDRARPTDRHDRPQTGRARGEPAAQYVYVGTEGPDGSVVDGYSQQPRPDKSRPRR